MKIATWNVNSIRTRLPILESWVKDSQPDIILLQELKCQDEVFPHEFVEDLGYNTAIYGQKTFNGVAILSKFPIEDITKGLPNFKDPEARYIEAFTGGVRVASVYAPNGSELGSEKYKYKLGFYSLLKNHIQNVLGHNEYFFMGGDYNVAPSDADVHDPQRWKGQVLVSDPERKAFTNLMEIGLADTLRHFHTEDTAEKEKWYTWWDYRKGAWPRNWGLRIDHILASQNTLTHIQEVGIDRNLRGMERPSDHAPYWCCFKN